MKRMYLSESESECDEFPEITNEEMKALIGYVLERGQECAKKFIEFKCKKATHREFWREMCSALPEEKIGGVNLSIIYEEIRDRIGEWVLYILEDLEDEKSSLRGVKNACSCKNIAAFFETLDANRLLKNRKHELTAAAAMIYYTAYPEKLENDLNAYSKHIHYEISELEEKIKKFKHVHDVFISISK